MKMQLQVFRRFSSLLLLFCRDVVKSWFSALVALQFNLQQKAATCGIEHFSYWMVKGALLLNVVILHPHQARHGYVPWTHSCTRYNVDFLHKDADFLFTF